MLLMGLLNHKEGNMNFYEMMFIQNPDLGEEDQEKLLTRLKNTIGKNGGGIIRIDDMGTRGLTYRIQKKPRGHYFLMYLEGPGSMIHEIERFLRIDENIMRFVIVKLDRHISRADLEPKVEAKAEPIPENQQEEVVEEHAE
ncbi:MAG TPA: 30S ribosomal protein S6 [Deltaproteobacteria bacterium]|nr:30S ribosomal protein S6 [Deltaproteobacteria bacterium]